MVWPRQPHSRGVLDADFRSDHYPRAIWRCLLKEHARLQEEDAVQRFCSEHCSSLQLRGLDVLVAMAFLRTGINAKGRKVEIQRTTSESLLPC